MTRFSLTAAGVPVSDVIGVARALGIDAVEADWRPGSQHVETLRKARRSGIQVSSLDLGALRDLTAASDHMADLVAVASDTSCRRLLLTAAGGTGDLRIGDPFIDSLRSFADKVEPLGIAVVVRLSRADENGRLGNGNDLLRVLASVNRGNVSAQVSFGRHSAAGDSVEHVTADLVGRIGHAALDTGDPLAHSGQEYTLERFLADLNAYGYGDVVSLALKQSDVAALSQLVDLLGGNDVIDSPRIAKVQQYLAAEGFDAAVFNAAKNVVSLTGYWPMNGTIVALVPREGEPHLLVPAGEETWAARSGWPNLHVYQAGRIIDAPMFDTIGAELSALARSNGLVGKRIAVEGAFRAQVPPHMAHEVSGRHEALRPVVAKAFGSEVVTLTEGYTRVRAAKTDRELRQLRRAAVVADVGLRTFRDGLADGVRDIDLATRVEGELERFGVGHDGVSRARGYAFVMSGPQTSQTHLDYEFSSTRRQRAGDSVLMEMAVVADGYWQDLSRIFVIGDSSEAQQRLFEVAEASFLAAVKAAVPGATGDEVDRAAREVVDDAGLSEAYPHQTGHGVGIAFHEQYPLLKPGSDHVLEEGNVIAIEPGVYLPGVGGVRNEDNLIVGDAQGAQTLQSVPHSLNVPLGTT